MVELLQLAFEKVSQLPSDQQEFYAQLLLDELESESRWEERFEQSQDALEQLAKEALDDFKAGRTVELTEDNLDELL